MDNVSTSLNLDTDVNNKKCVMKTFYNIVVIVVVFYVIYVLYKYFSYSENFMSTGVISDLFGKDIQDLNLNSGVKNIASGNYNLMWNNPSRITDTLPNRGGFYLSQNQKPLIVKNSDYNQVPNGLLNDNGKNEILNNDYETIKTTSNNCIIDNPSCGNGDGGYRLNGDIVNPLLNSNSPEMVNGSLFYPNSYVPSLFIEPEFNINHEYPYMPLSNVV